MRGRILLQVWVGLSTVEHSTFVDVESVRVLSRIFDQQRLLFQVAVLVYTSAQRSSNCRHALVLNHIGPRDMTVWWILLRSSTELVRQGKHRPGFLNRCHNLVFVYRFDIALLYWRVISFAHVVYRQVATMVVLGRKHYRSFEVIYWLVCVSEGPVSLSQVVPGCRLLGVGTTNVEVTVDFNAWLGQLMVILLVRIISCLLQIFSVLRGWCIL